ncbi:MAG TPA: hypothetical protein VGI86_04280, partial [Acidimicrobiia bacterium]
MRALDLVAFAALALFGAGCGGADERAGAAREAELAAPLLGRKTIVAVPGSAPIAVQPALASRGNDFLAVWSTLGPQGGALVATRFAADGKPSTPDGITLATFENIDVTPTIAALTCAPDGDCLVVDFHADSRNLPETGITTLRADGSVLHDDHDGPTDAGNSVIAAAFDGQSFVLAWPAPKLTTLRFADGAPLGKPAILDIESILTGLACA